MTERSPRAAEPFPIATSALLLDMDGTLIDSGGSVERAWDRMFDRLGVRRRFDHALHGRPARGVIREVFGELPEDRVEAIHEGIEQLEIEDAGEVEVLPGTLRLIGELDEVSRRVGRQVWTVVTSCTRPLFEARWACTGLPIPSQVVTADQVTHGKPDPEPFEEGARRLGVDPAEAVAVEDSVGGLTAASAAGVLPLAVTTTTPAADLAPCARALLTSLDDLVAGVAAGRLLLDRREV